MKGAFAVVVGLTQPSPAASTAANELEAQGFRVLAVAVGPPPALQLAGLIALSDPPRADSAERITELRTLGVRTVMVTGDAPATAAIVAPRWGLRSCLPAWTDRRQCAPGRLRVFAGVLPEGKYHLVKAFQRDGHAVGMCGDGANNAPALRQAQMGIAVSTATDVAKSAAGIVLTEPGLGGIVASVKEGRVTFQRILTYTLNSVNKKVVQVLFLAVGLIMTGHAILTPMLMVIIMITGDFLGMSLTTDNVRPSPLPNAWRIGRLTNAGVFMGILELVFCSAVLAVGEFGMEFETGGAENSGVCRHRVRQSGDDLCHSRTSAPVVLSPQLLARGVIGRRYPDRLDVGHLGNPHDAFADFRCGRHACRVGRLRICCGFGQGAGIRATWDRMIANHRPIYSRSKRRPPWQTTASISATIFILISPRATPFDDRSDGDLMDSV